MVLKNLSYSFDGYGLLVEDQIVPQSNSPQKVSLTFREKGAYRFAQNFHVVSSDLLNIKMKGPMMLYTIKDKDGYALQCCGENASFRCALSLRFKNDKRMPENCMLVVIPKGVTHAGTPYPCITFVLSNSKKVKMRW
ncbi:MAG TPA: hypothetical protein VHK91_09595 [Flavisolibacter sp.]|jgi:hypothetical protein|nr:hypothetical protein [Flavisolibacter sp.]